MPWVHCKPKLKGAGLLVWADRADRAQLLSCPKSVWSQLPGCGPASPHSLIGPRHLPCLHDPHLPLSLDPIIHLAQLNFMLTPRRAMATACPGWPL